MSILSPDGRSIEITGVPLNFTGPWGFKCSLRRQANVAILHTGTVGSYEAVQQHTGTLQNYLRREVSFRGRPLISHEAVEETATTTFLWLGTHHEVSWTVAGRDVSFEIFTEALSAVDVDDSPGGMRLVPRRGTSASVAMTLAANTFTDLCAVLVTPTTSPSLRVPSHAGKKVRGGVMWRTDALREDGTMHRTATIASPTAVTDLGFFEPDAPANMEIVEKLQVHIA
jgi:hypothetical protein